MKVCWFRIFFAPCLFLCFLSPRYKLGMICLHHGITSTKIAWKSSLETILDVWNASKTSLETSARITRWVKNPVRYAELSIGSYEFQGLHIASQKKGEAAQNTARPMTYACPHISEKWRDQEVVTSISEITDDVNCCQVVPSYTFASNRKKPIQSMELNHNLLSIMLFSSHLQPQNLSSTETSPRPGGCDGRPISIMLQDDGMTFRVRREHEDGLFSWRHQESLTRQRMRRTRNRKTTSTIQVCILYRVWVYVIIYNKSL